MNPLSLANSASVVLEQVVKRYNPKGPAAVDNVSLRFEAGSLTTLLGPSGCGKTTTLRMIAGLETATSGRILIGDKDVTRLPATERGQHQDVVATAFHAGQRQAGGTAQAAGAAGHQGDAAGELGRVRVGHGCRTPR